MLIDQLMNNPRTFNISLLYTWKHF
jgi:hypothetical protein